MRTGVVRGASALIYCRFKPTFGGDHNLTIYRRPSQNQGFIAIFNVLSNKASRIILHSNFLGNSSLGEKIKYDYRLSSESVVVVELMDATDEDEAYYMCNATVWNKSKLKSQERKLIVGGTYSFAQLSSFKYPFFLITGF